MRRVVMLGLALVMFLSLAAAAEAFQIFTVKSAWEAAVDGQFSKEEFTDANLNDGVSFTSTASGHINTALGYYQDVLTSTNANEPMTTWSFTPQITGYGGDWTLAGGGGSGNSLWVYVDNLTNPVGFIPSSYNGGFWGFISPTPFSKVLLKGGTGTNQQIYQLDNMVYSQVPVPGTLGLLSSGLLGLFFFRRKVF